MCQVAWRAQRADDIYYKKFWSNFWREKKVHVILVDNVGESEVPGYFFSPTIHLEESVSWAAMSCEWIFWLDKFAHLGKFSSTRGKFPCLKGKFVSTESKFFSLYISFAESHFDCPLDMKRISVSMGKTKTLWGLLNRVGERERERKKEREEEREI